MKLKKIESTVWQGNGFGTSAAVWAVKGKEHIRIEQLSCGWTATDTQDNTQLVRGQHTRRVCLEILAHKLEKKSRLLKAGDLVEVRGFRYFQKSYGNTYNSVDIYINRELVATLPREYGYGDYYLQRAGEWLAELGYTNAPRHSNGARPSLWSCAEKQRFHLVNYARDCLSRELANTGFNDHGY